jgi:hypothetical protein
VYVVLLFIVLFIVFFLLFPGIDDGRYQITIEHTGLSTGVSTFEVMPFDNCEGDEEVEQDIRVQRRYPYTIEIIAFPDVTVNKQAVENEIRRYYEVSEFIGIRECTIPVQVPAGSAYGYKVEYTEVWCEGVIELGEPDGAREGTYRFKCDLLCEVVGRETESCSASTDIIATLSAPSSQ